MKKILLALLVSLTLNSIVFGQCTVTPILIDSLIDCGDSSEIQITGFALSAISESFSAAGPTDPGWQTTAGAVYNNPFIPSPPAPNSGAIDGGIYFWMGATNVLPAALETVPFNVTFGGQICFDFVYAIQGGPTNIAEGPDLSEEGITLQYSPDGGITWVDIVYFMPNGEQLPSNPGPNFPMNNPPFSNTGTPYTVWNSVCFPIPAGALGANTSFQWIQEFNSGACCDHWGLDNITVQLADPAYTFYDENFLAIDTNFIYVSPTDTQSYTITYTNGIDDTCTGTVLINVNPTLVMDDFFICEGVGSGDTLTLTGVAPWAPVLWTPAIGLDDPTSQTPFANPPSPGPSQTYTATSACGVDSVTTTFYSVSAVAEKGTVCPGEIDQLFANVSGISQDCNESYTGFSIPYYKEFSANQTPLNFSNPDNGTSTIINLPFPFEFYCSPITEIRAAVDGYLMMSSSAFPSFANNLTIPVNILPNQIAALMWDDLVDSSGLSSFFVTGNAPNRKMVVEFDLVHKGGTSQTEQVQGQIILHETTHFIDLLCENCINDDSDPTSTQGIENSSGFSGQATPGRNNTNWEAINSGYRYIPNTPSATSQTITWTPNLNVFGANTLAPLVTPDTTTTYTVTVINNSDSCTYTDTVTVFVEESLSIDASPDTSICLGENLVIPATTTAVGGGIIFEWTPNNSSIINNTVLNPSVSPDTTTSYILEANLNGCVAFDTIVVGISSFIVDSNTLVDEICIANSGSITINVSGQTLGLQYSIDDGTNYQASNIFNGLSGGNYDIRIGSINCDTAYSVNIVGGAALITTDSIVVVNSNCGALGSIAVYASGGTPPLQYSIDSGATLSIDSFYSNLIGGQYNVRIQDNFGCIQDTLITLEETPTLDLIPDSISMVSCFGAVDGSVALTTTGGQPPFQYSLDDVNYISANTFTNLDTGIYMAYAIDSNGCNDSVMFNITQPDLLDVQITVPGNVLCAGGTIDSLSADVSGGTPNFTYLWNTSEVIQSIQNIVFGNYWVQVTDLNLCVASDSVIIAQPNPLFLSITSDSALCSGQNSGLAHIDSFSGGTPIYTYNWEGPLGPVAGIDTAAALPAGQYILTIADFNGCTVSDTTVIFEPSPVTIVLTPTSLACYADTSACIDAAVSGGTPPYTYSWSHGPTLEDVCGLSAGVYTFTLTDSRGCIYVDSAEVTQPDSLNLSTTQINVTCNGFNNGSATALSFGGTLPYTYNWIGIGQTTATVNNLFAGSYTVLVTDGGTCADSISVLITEPTDSITLTIDNIDNVACNGNSTGSISISTFGGTPNYTYAWSNGGGNNEDLSNASAGAYTLTVTDLNGCPNSINTIITEPAALSINLAGTSATCFGASTASIDAIISGGVTPYSYAWTGPNAFTANTEDISSLAAGSYTLTVIDSNNCQLTQNIVLTQPSVVSISFDQIPVSCFGGNDGSLTANITSGSTAPYAFQWGTAANNQNTATATGLSEGTYTVTITDGNGCAFADNATVTEPTLPLNILMDSTNITCAGYNNGIGSVSPSGGTPGYTYLWNDPQAQTNNIATDLAAGNYQVIVTDANGCAKIGSITINEPTPISIVAIPDSTNCFGDASGTITIQANGGTTIGFGYSIDGGENFQSSANFFNLPAGVYNEIIVQDLGSSEECLSVQVSTTIYEQPYFSFVINPDDTTLQLEQSLSLSLEVTSPNYTNADIAQVNWFPTAGLDCDDCIDPIVLTYDNYTEYTATVYYEGDDNELCNSFSSTIIIVENNLALFIPNAFTPGNFDEVNRNFEVFGEGIEFITMQVYNRWGEKIFESANQKASWDGTFKGELQNPGVYTYFVSIEYLDGKTLDRKGSVTLLR